MGATARLGAAASGFSCSGTGSSLAYSSCVRTTGDSAISTCAAQGRHTRTRTVGSVCRKRDGWRGSGAKGVMVQRIALRTEMA
eukprot:scaffold25919_cov57-Phaeocystis_antarctica.AAC.1